MDGPANGEKCPTKLMPAVFVGHGNPMHALGCSPYAEAWASLGKSLPRPRAILSISAHWYIADAAVTVSSAPKTIHDFVGFPRKLHRVRYPAPGDPQLATRIGNLLAPLPVAPDEHWGLDHGTWSVLCHLYPEADIPVVQLSIDQTQPPAFHFDIGKRLAPLREEGVLLIGSGNLVHNLRAYAWGKSPVEPHSWATRFEQRVKDHLLAEDMKPLIEYQTRLGEEAALAAPSPDHYLPLLYVLGARQEAEPLHFPVEGIEGGSVSMLAVQTG